MIETLVIGSGIAGLTTALICAKAGQKVHILEQAPYLGGLLISYKRKGHNFPTGVHYVGQAGPNELLGRLWHYLGLNDLNLQKMDIPANDILYYPGYRLPMAGDREELARTLSFYFPNEKAVVEAYFNRMKEICDGLALYNLRPMTAEVFSDEDYQPLGAWLRQLGASEAFISAVGYVSFLHGLTPDDCPLFTHMIIHDSFLHGNYRFAGGSQSFVDAFIKQLSAYGVNSQTGVKVVGIVREIGGLKVTTADGQVFEAKRVVYTGDIGQLPTIMMGKMLRPAFVQRIQDLKYTKGIMGVSLLLSPEADLTAHNHYLYHDGNSSSHLQQNLLNGEINGLFVSADEPGAAHILATMSGEDVDKLSAMTRTDYMNCKKDLAARIQQFAAQFLPDLASGQIVDVFTPLTFSRYTGITGGSAYGIAKSVEQARSGRFTPVSKIPGLYFAGQSVILPGIVGASISGMAVASVILGNEWVNQVS